VAIWFTDPDRDTGKLCLDGGMHTTVPAFRGFLMLFAVAILDRIECNTASSGEGGHPWENPDPHDPSDTK